MIPLRSQSTDPLQNNYTQRLSNTWKTSSIVYRWIRKSKPAYSLPVVCVRLCIDYRELNRRTVTDRHPLRRVQTTLENLGGNSWFSPRKSVYTPRRPIQDHPLLSTPPGAVRVGSSALRPQECARGVSAVYGELPGWDQGLHMHSQPR